MIESDFHLPNYMFIFCMEIKCYNKKSQQVNISTS